MGPLTVGIVSRGELRGAWEWGISFPDFAHLKEDSMHF